MNAPNSNCKLWYSVSPTLNVNPTLFVIPCNFGRFIDLQCCDYCHLPSDFSSKFQSSMTIFHHKLLTREGKVLANERTHSSSMTIFCSLIHKYHPKSYHSGISNLPSDWASLLLFKKGKRNSSSMLPPEWNTVLLHFRVGLSLYAIPNRALQELKKPWRSLLPFKRQTPWMSTNNLTGTYLHRGQYMNNASNYPKIHSINLVVACFTWHSPSPNKIFLRDSSKLTS